MSAPERTAANLRRQLALTALFCLACPRAPVDGNTSGGGAGTCAGKSAGEFCAQDMVCNVDGDCVACDPGAPCETGVPCERAAISCESGAPVCRRTGSAPAGADCQGGFCLENGVCEPCVAGEPCVVDGDGPCVRSETVCAPGAPRCQRVGIHGADRVCNVPTDGCLRPSFCDGVTGACPPPAQAPENARCDDGIHCNGADSCSGGACVLHDGNPCKGDTNICTEQPAACVQCVQPDDCVDRIENRAGCLVVGCESGACTSTARHDGVTWRVSPVFSDEVLLSRSADTLDAHWDGHDFLVAMKLADGNVVARRISPDGALLETEVFYLEPNARGLAFAGDRYLVVTVEPGGSVHPYDYIGGYQMGRAGQRLGPTFPALVDFGAGCGGEPANLAGPVVAGSGNVWMVWATSCGAISGKIVGGMGGTASILPMYRPRGPRLTSRDNGFAVILEELYVGGGRNEAWAEQYDLAANVTAPYQPVQPYVQPTGCCITNQTLAWGNTGYLMAYQRIAFTLETVSGTLQETGTVVTLPSNMYPNYVDVEMGFDGSNFLVVGAYSADGLPAYRVTEAGVLLDDTPIMLTPPGSGLADQPQLASDRAGHFLIAYRRGDGHVYARTFTTCP